MALGDLAFQVRSQGQEALSRIGLNQAQEDMLRRQMFEVAPNAAAQRSAEAAQAFATTQQGKATGMLAPAEVAARNAGAALANAQAASVPRTTAAQTNLMNTQAAVAPIDASSLADMRSASGMLARTQAGVLPAETGARIGLEDLQGRQLGQEIGTRGNVNAGINALPNPWDRVRASAILASPGSFQLPSLFDPNTNPGLSGVTPQLPQPPLDPAQLPGGASGGMGTVGFAKGTDAVPDQQELQASPETNGATDTVPALLTPGEAVLNKAAAEHVGRGLIQHLNNLGLTKMAGGQPTSRDVSGGTSKETSREPSKRAPTAKDAGKTASAPKSSDGLSGKSGNGKAPTASRAPDSQRSKDAKGMPRKYAGGTDDITAYNAGNQDRADDAGSRAANGFIGLNNGGGLGQNMGGWLSAAHTMLTGGGGGDQSPMMQAPTPAAPTGPSNFTPLSAPSGAGFNTLQAPQSSFSPLTPSAGMPRFQSFAAGVEEVLPLAETMSGLDQRALAGRAKEDNQNIDKVATATLAGAGGMQKFAKGSRAVKSKGGASSKSLPAMPAPLTAPMVPAPAMSAMPMTSVPQPSYPGGSSL